jgi:hypothetical protein
LRKQPELAERLAQSAFAGVRRHYSVQNSADRALDVYASVVEKRTPAAVDLAVQAAV